MEKDKTLLLTNKQIEQKLNRLAFQIFEDNSDAKEIVLAGIVKVVMKLLKNCSYTQNHCSIQGHSHRSEIHQTWKAGSENRY